MKTIELDKKSRLLLEHNNYTLQYLVPTGIGPNGAKPIADFKWISGGYFPTLDSALKDWVGNAPVRQNDGKIKTLHDVVKCIQDAEAHIEKLIHNK